MFRRALLLGLLCLSAAPLAAAEPDEKPVRRVAPVSPGPPRPLWVGAPRPEGSAGCVLGEPGPSVGNDFDSISPASGPDAYYTLLSTPGCPTCVAPDSVLLEVVHVELAFPVICAQPVTISIVGAGGGPSCRAPDTTQVIAGPFATSISPSINGLYTFNFVLPAPVKIGADAFLGVKFLAFPPECAAPDNPRLRIAATCSLCHAYNDYFHTGTGMMRRSDLCLSAVSPVMSVSSTQCVVPVLPRTWGALKHHYR